MYKDILSSINNITVYPIIGILVFFIFFVGVILWSYYFIDKEQAKKLANLVYNDAQIDNNNLK